MKQQTMLCLVYAIASILLIVATYTFVTQAIANARTADIDTLNILIDLVAGVIMLFFSILAVLMTMYYYAKSQRVVRKN